MKIHVCTGSKNPQRTSMDVKKNEPPESWSNTTSQKLYTRCAEYLGHAACFMDRNKVAWTSGQHLYWSQKRTSQISAKPGLYKECIYKRWIGPLVHACVGQFGHGYTWSKTTSWHHSVPLKIDLCTLPAFVSWPPLSVHHLAEREAHGCLRNWLWL